MSALDPSYFSVIWITKAGEQINQVEGVNIVRDNQVLETVQVAHFVVHIAGFSRVTIDRFWYFGRIFLLQWWYWRGACNYLFCFLVQLEIIWVEGGENVGGCFSAITQFLG